MSCHRSSDSFDFKEYLQINSKIFRFLFSFFTTDGCMLFEVLSPYVDVFHQALASMSPPLLNRVLGTQREHCHVLQRQTEAAQATVELLGKTLPHLVALILQGIEKDAQRTVTLILRRRQMMKWFRGEIELAKNDTQW